MSWGSPRMQVKSPPISNWAAPVTMRWCLLFNTPVYQTGAVFFPTLDNNTHIIHHLISAPPLWTESSDAAADLTLYLQLSFKWCVQMHKFCRNTSKCFIFSKHKETYIWMCLKSDIISSLSFFITSSQQLSLKSSARPVRFFSAFMFYDLLWFFFASHSVLISYWIVSKLHSCLNISIFCCCFHRWCSTRLSLLQKNTGNEMVNSIFS